MTTQENYEQLKSTIDALQVDFEKFQNKKVKAAGQRARNHLLTAKKLCDTLRKQIMTEMKAIPTRHRISDTESEDKDDEKEEIPPSPPKLVRQVGGENITEETHDIKPIEILGVKTVIATPKEKKEEKNEVEEIKDKDGNVIEIKPKRRKRKANKKK